MTVDIFSLPLIATTVILLLASWIDIKWKLIPNEIPILLTIINGLYYITHLSIDTWYYVFITIGLFLFLFLPKSRLFPVGGGDLKVVTALTLSLGFTIIINAFCVCAIYLGGVSVIALLHKQKRQKVALAPAIFIAFLITILYGSLF
jgi:Flp pilus assembly protein protease CpaA